MSRFSSPISIPNILTLVRILLTPVFVILLLRGLYAYALAVFVFAGLSDGLDGFIARYFNQRTALGAYLDPTADKLLLVSSFVTLAALQVIPAWVAVVVITRDVLIVVGIAIFTLFEKSYEVHPSIWSKLTTASQLLLVAATLFDPARTRLPDLHAPLIWVTAGVTILSGLHYIYIGMSILQETGES